MLDVETDAYIHCVSAFVKLAQSEYQLLMEVIPEHHQKKTFDSLIQVLLLPPCCSEHDPPRVTVTAEPRVGQASCPEPSTLFGVVPSPVLHSILAFLHAPQSGPLSLGANSVLIPLLGCPGRADA